MEHQCSWPGRVSPPRVSPQDHLPHTPVLSLIYRPARYIKQTPEGHRDASCEARPVIWLGQQCVKFWGSSVYSWGCEACVYFPHSAPLPWLSGSNWGALVAWQVCQKNYPAVFQFLNVSFEKWIVFLTASLLVRVKPMLAECVILLAGWTKLLMSDRSRPASLFSFFLSFSPVQHEFVSCQYDLEEVDLWPLLRKS